MEQGPTTTRSRFEGSVPSMARSASRRPRKTVALAFGVRLISCWSKFGGARGMYPRTITNELGQQIPATASSKNCHVLLASSKSSSSPMVGFSRKNGMLMRVVYPSNASYLEMLNTTIRSALLYIFATPSTTAVNAAFNYRPSHPKLQTASSCTATKASPTIVARQISPRAGKPA